MRDLFQAYTYAALLDFLTFRQPCSYKKFPLVVHWLLSLQRKPKIMTLFVYKFARDLRGYAVFVLPNVIIPSGENEKVWKQEKCPFVVRVTPRGIYHKTQGAGQG